MDNAKFYKQWKILQQDKEKLFEQKRELQDRIDSVIYKQDKWKKEYLESNAFSVGTKVTLNRIYVNKEYKDSLNGGHYLIFSSQLTVYPNKLVIEYELSKPKKDGTLPLTKIKGLEYIKHDELIEGWV